METWRLYFDGQCPLCLRAEKTATRWAERASVPFEARPIQCVEGAPLVLTLQVGERSFTSDEAWIKLLTIAPWPLRWIGLAAERSKGFARIVRGVYKVVARYRRRNSTCEACSLPR